MSALLERSTASDEDPDVVAERQWQEEFDRRSRDARAGLHHPMLHELLLRMPPLHDAVDADAQIFAERLLARLAEDGQKDGTLVGLLQALTLAPTREACRAAAAALEADWNEREVYVARYLADAAARCEFYAAVKGCGACAFRVAGRALAYAHDQNLPNVARLALFEAALGWLLRAGWDLPDVIERLGPETGGPAERRAAELGAEAMRHIEVLLEP